MSTEHKSFRVFSSHVSKSLQESEVVEEYFLVAVSPEIGDGDHDMLLSGNVSAVALYHALLHLFEKDARYRRVAMDALAEISISEITDDND